MSRALRAMDTLKKLHKRINVAQANGDTQTAERLNARYNQLLDKTLETYGGSEAFTQEYMTAQAGSAMPSYAQADANFAGEAPQFMRPENQQQGIAAYTKEDANFAGEAPQWMRPENQTGPQPQRQGPPNPLYSVAPQSNMPDPQAQMHSPGSSSLSSGPTPGPSNQGNRRGQGQGTTYGIQRDENPAGQMTGFSTIQESGYYDPQQGDQTRTPLQPGMGGDADREPGGIASLPGNDTVPPTPRRKPKGFNGKGDVKTKDSGSTQISGPEQNTGSTQNSVTTNPDPLSRLNTPEQETDYMSQYREGLSMYDDLIKERQKRVDESGVGLGQTLMDAGIAMLGSGDGATLAETLAAGASTANQSMKEQRQAARQAEDALNAAKIERAKLRMQAAQTGMDQEMRQREMALKERELASQVDYWDKKVKADIAAAQAKGGMDPKDIANLRTDFGKEVRKVLAGDQFGNTIGPDMQESALRSLTAVYAPYFGTTPDKLYNYALDTYAKERRANSQDINDATADIQS